MPQDSIVTSPIGLPEGMPILVRLLLILLFAGGAHLVVRLLQWAVERLLLPARLPAPDTKDAFARRYPKAATVISLVVSAITFGIYFAAIGLLLGELGVNLTAYFATATVIGLAVGFGSQGLVQDVVIGLTLLFSDAFDIGDTIEVAGQVGRVERLGLRFTTIVSFLGAAVYVPNRNIAQVVRYPQGVIRAYVDVQLPDADAEDDDVRRMIAGAAAGFRAQHRAIVLADPEVSRVQSVSGGSWRYVRVSLRIWPGQGALVETMFRQRLIGEMKKLDPSYADWMVAVTYRVLPDGPAASTASVPAASAGRDRK